MREIIARVLDATERDGVRIAARDTVTGAKIEMPWPSGVDSGREAQESVARRILKDGERLSWGRDTGATTVFLVIGS